MRTVPSIPIEEKELRFVGPQSYIVNDNITSKSPAGLIMKQHSKPVSVMEAKFTREDQKLRFKAMKYLSPKA